MTPLFGELTDGRRHGYPIEKLEYIDDADYCEEIKNYYSAAMIPRGDCRAFQFRGEDTWWTVYGVGYHSNVAGYLYAGHEHIDCVQLLPFYINHDYGELKPERRTGSGKNGNGKYHGKYADGSYRRGYVGLILVDIIRMKEFVVADQKRTVWFFRGDDKLVEIQPKIKQLRMQI